ncbi:MAG: chemotaxis protein CheW [Pseudolabrys sp.]
MTTDAVNESFNEYVTAVIGGQIFGLPILHVQDVFAVTRLTRVPLAPPEIAGLLNLRGKIVTLIDLRRRFGFDAVASDGPRMAVGIEANGESYGLLIDSIGEVMRLDAEDCEPVPINLDPQLAEIASGVYRLDGGLLVVADVGRILSLGGTELAA